MSGRGRLGVAAELGVASGEPVKYDGDLIGCMSGEGDVEDPSSRLAPVLRFRESLGGPLEVVDAAVPPVASSDDVGGVGIPVSIDGGLVARAMGCMTGKEGRFSAC